MWEFSNGLQSRVQQQWNTNEGYHRIYAEKLSKNTWFCFYIMELNENQQDDIWPLLNILSQFRNYDTQDVADNINTVKNLNNQIINMQRELTRKQQELIDKQVMLDAAMKSAEILVWRYDHVKNCIYDVNDIEKEWELPTHEEHTPQDWIDQGLIAEDSKGDFHALYADVKQGKKASRDIKLSTANARGHEWRRIIYTPILDKQGNCHESIGTVFDITEQKERELNYENQLRIADILNQSEILTGLFNITQNRVERINFQDENDASYIVIDSIDTAVQSMIDFYVDQSDREIIQANFQSKKLLDEYFAGQYNRKFRHSNKNRTGWLEASYKLIQNPYTADIEAIVMLRDISELVRTEQIVVKQQAQLKDALEAARKANLAKTDFLSRMSHDIRTPLNAILNLNRLMSEELDHPKKLQEDIAKIDVAGEFLLQLINDVLDISRIESGHLELKPRVYTYATFLNYIRGIVTPLCEDKDITFLLEEGPTALDIYMDRARFHQVFFNLLSNAVKFTPPGGTVSFTTCNNVIHDGVLTCDFIVADTGCGMSQETIKHAFEPFVRGNSTDAYVGSGLGLAICKQILDKMGATIKIESEVGKGTKITVHMDLLIATKEQIQDSQAEIDTSYHGSPVFRSAKDCRILIAEDNAINAEILRRLLEKKEMQTEHVYNGEDAVKALHTHESDYYQMVLMDVRMPILDGIEATKKIRQMKKEMKRNIPIIAITANAFESDMKECIDAGMNSCLAKPVSPKKLYESIATYIKLEN